MNLVTTRTITAALTNDREGVARDLDSLARSGSKIWNVARWTAGRIWGETGEIPDEGPLKSYMKNQPCWRDLNAQSSQAIVEELAGAFQSWFEQDNPDANPPGYRKHGDQRPRSTITFKEDGFKLDTKHQQVRLSKGKNLKDGWSDFILCEYQAPPAVDVENIQQVRAVYNARKGRWELHVVCETAITAESPGEKTAGVDLGICNPAAVAFPDEALLYPGDTLREDKHYFQQEEYQTDGPHGPSQKAQWARETLSRRKEHFLHALSKDIVERCVDHEIGTLVVGDPSGVDEDDWGRHGNKRLDNWAYKRVMNLLDYKARERGIEVELPDERGTSSSCSVCGHEDADSRVERGLWKCDRCGVVAHGDVNGADNIRQETLPVTPPLGKGDSGNGCLAQPRVIQFSRTHGFQPRATAE